MYSKKTQIVIISIFVLAIALLSFIEATAYLTKSNQWGSNLTNIKFGSTVLGDIDNDGDLDLIATGACGISCNSANVYINNGSTLNENSTWQQNLTGVNYGSLSLGDIDNDGDLDLALSGCNNGGNGLVTACNEGGYQTFIYLNNGTSFNEDSTWQSNLTKSWKGSLAFADIDNDGDLDLALSGSSSAGYISKIYINNGTSLIESSQWQSDLVAVYESALTFGDIDNDNDLDLALCGDAGTSNERTKIYLNNGTSFVESSQWQNNLLAVDWCSIAFGDYDNDNDLDLTLIGHTTQDNHRIYRNNGTSFVEIQKELGDLIGIFAGSIAFGDYDVDGYLDLIAIGNEGYTTLYLYNSSNTNFTTSSQDPENLFDLDYGSSVVWVDLDNDTDLDLIETGYGSEGGGAGNATVKAYVYLSNRSLTKNNTKPSAPTTNFTSNYSNGILNLSWGNGSDSETPTLGLYYNLMIGNSTTNHTIVSGIYGGSSNPTAGYFGNMMQRKSITLNRYLSEGTYNWYVQTIDTGLAKSNWSSVQSFVVNNDSTAPNISSVSSSVTSSTATITWTTDESANSTVYYGTTTATTSSSSSDNLVSSHSISLSSLSASTLYYYNVSSCDYWNNCNNSVQYSFTTSATPTTPSSGGGGGGSTTTTTNVTPIPEEELFDIDFSSESSGSLEVKEGEIKTFSFNSQIKHSITIMTLTTDSITLLITSNPITIQIKTGETKQIDINSDGINDIEIKLVSITNRVANLLFKKLEGADIAAQEEIEEAVRKEALFDVKVRISNLFKVVKSGRDVIAEIEVFNVNNIGQVDVGIDYYITSKDDNTTLLVQGSDTLAVEAVTSFVRSLKIPYNVRSGAYYFNVDVKYNDNIMASGHAEFRVIRNYEIIAVVGVILLIVVCIFVYLWRIKRKEEKIEKKEVRLEGIVRKLKKKIKK